MCGIVGVVFRDPTRAVSAESIDRMCAAIRHRGPDDSGRFLAGPVGLGMRRLAIIDPALGRQPIVSPDGGTAIVFNGEIYNFRKLRAELERRGDRFRTNGDTEVVLHAYLRSGPRCVDPLRGMFAFAIWDGQKRELFVARDRYGIKPLYYLEGPWGLAFASELKALLAFGGSTGELDHEGLDAFFALGYLPAPYSPFRDIRKLPPGHILTWSAEAPLRLERYWDPAATITAPPPEPERRVLEWIDDSVQAHLVSDVPVAAFLSGGLDSSAVVASMALQGATPHAFTARYHGSGAAATDETELARILADRYGARLSVVDIEARIDDLLEPITWALDEPHADDSALPTWLLSRAVGAEYKVALTGIGGDELFAGYRRHFGLGWSTRFGQLPAPWRRGLRATVDHLGRALGTAPWLDRLRRFAHIDAADPPGRYLQMVALLPHAERRALFGGNGLSLGEGGGAARLFAEHYVRAGRPTDLTAALQLDTRTFLPDDVLALADRLSMAHGLELRVPFVDHRLAAEVTALPEATKVGRGRPKQLLRRALASRLPAEHFRAPKRGFVGPTGHWLRHELRPVLLDELSPARMARLGLFDNTMVQRMLTEHFEGQRDRERILWALLNFSVWHRLYCEAPSAPAALRRPA